MFLTSSTKHWYGELLPKCRCSFSDGEENAMPVLTNRMLVTETCHLPMRGTGTKNFSFDKLLNQVKVKLYNIMH